VSTGNEDLTSASRSAPSSGTDASARVAAGGFQGRARKVLAGGVTRDTVFVPPHPPYLRRGRGFEVVDESGRTLIDAQNNYTALVHGHAHEAVTEAAQAAVSESSCFGLPTRWEIDLAEHLQDRVPTLERMRFTNSGTEAVMTAIRVARRVTGRPRVLRFDGAYHGSYDAVIDGGGVSPGLEAETVRVPFGDVDRLQAAVETYGEEIACVLLDLMPNRAGLRPASHAFADAAQQAARDCGALLLVDEIITARLVPAGLHIEYGLRPDLLTLGKMVGGGFPVGVFGGTAETMSVLEPGVDDPLGHGGTFTANPVTMRAGFAAMAHFGADEVARINRLGDRLRNELLDRGHDVTGRGSLLRLHPRSTDAEARHRLWWQLYEAGVLVAGNGLMALSTPMRDATVDEILERFGGITP
jgi:glutamate-1-semialdehyde 2,1-aminomutase